MLLEGAESRRQPIGVKSEITVGDERPKKAGPNRPGLFAPSIQEGVSFNFHSRKDENWAAVNQDESFEFFE
jgi:hypothetical protein